MDTKSTDSNIIYRIAQDPRVGIAGASGKFGNWISAIVWVDLKRCRCSRWHLLVGW